MNKNCVIFKSSKNTYQNIDDYYDVFDSNLHENEIKIISEEYIDTNIIYNKTDKNMYIEKDISLKDLNFIMHQFMEYYISIYDYDYINLIKNIYIEKNKTYQIAFMSYNGNTYTTVINNLINKCAYIYINFDLKGFIKNNIELFMNSNNVNVFKYSGTYVYIIDSLEKSNTYDGAMNNIKVYDKYITFEDNADTYILGEKNTVIYTKPYKI